MGFFGNIIKSVAQVALTPVTIMEDTYDILTGDLDSDSKTWGNLSNAGNSIEEAFDDLLDGEL